MAWLEEVGNSCDLMAASGMGARGKAGTAQFHHALYFDGKDEDSSRQGKQCYKSGEIGHFKRGCPKNSLSRGCKSAGWVKNNASKQNKYRPLPKNKKFHCGLHKDAPGKSFSIWSCAAVKYMKYEERLKL